MEESISICCSAIDFEISHLKRKLGAADLQGHTCDQCENFRIPPLPRTTDFENIPFFELDTTVKQIREEFAVSGCQFWNTIQDLLTFVSLEARGHKTKDLRRRYIGSQSWGYGLNRQVEVDDAADWPNAVRVILRYQSTKTFPDSPIKMEAVVQVPWPGYDNGDAQTNFSHHNEFSIPFLVMSLPGDLADMRRVHMGAPLNLAPQSPLAMTLVQHWIRKCEVEHGCGIEALPASMPYFLLDVSNKNTIRLVDMSGLMPERYITLSYCWGVERQKVMLTKDTENALITGLSPDQFDPSIRDSSMLVRELGFRYLWVDALCIRQDDEAFTVTELQKMSNIFHNATFTLVASAAKSVREGYLSPRASSAEKAAATPKGRVPSVLKFKVAREDEIETPHVTLWPLYADDPKRDHWYRRAWTLQEMLFSHRRLKYRGGQTTWECHCTEAAVYECDGGSIAPDNLSVPLFHGFAPLVRTQPHGRPSRAALLKYWYSVLGEYLSRDLTYARDRLPAIAGVAKEFAAALEDDYICGLWKSDMSTSLLWTSRGSGSFFSDEKPRPSWSWASTSGSAFGEGMNKGRFFDAWQSEDFAVSAHEVALAVSTAQLGNANRACLYLHGLLAPMPTLQRTQLSTAAKTDLGGQKVSVDWDYGDDLRHQPASTAQLALLLVKNDASSAWGLVLAAEDYDNEYSRVGHFYIDTIWSDNNRGPMKARKECRARLQELWGGEHHVRSIILV